MDGLKDTQMGAGMDEWKDECMDAGMYELIYKWM